MDVGITPKKAAKRMGKFWLYRAPINIGVAPGQRGAYMPPPQAFESLEDAKEEVERNGLGVGLQAWIDGPNGSYVFSAGSSQWSQQFSPAAVPEGVGGLDGITQRYVERRVDDWESRIGSLYVLLISWLPAGWEADQRSAVRMHEELMREFHLPARELPVLTLIGGEGVRRRVEPRILWINGVNGRLDLSGGPDHYVIVDVAEKFAEPSWRIARLSDREVLAPLTKERFIEALQA